MSKENSDKIIQILICGLSAIVNSFFFKAPRENVVFRLEYISPPIIFLKNNSNICYKLVLQPIRMLIKCNFYFFIF